MIRTTRGEEAPTSAGGFGYRRQDIRRRVTHIPSAVPTKKAARVTPPPLLPVINSGCSDADRVG